ncbi:MAG: hypothetical protein RL342_741 [Pseudomonadota bacterium]|nr:hypothetical protein LBMAG30_20420 [Comamonadaceae bacterium]
MADFETEEFADGQLVFSAGDFASHLFYIKQGAVQILAESGAVIAEVAQGQSFGETAILKGGVRSFSVRAKGAMVCSKIGSDEAAQLLTTYSPFLVTILEALLLQQNMHNKLRQRSEA